LAKAKRKAPARRPTAPTHSGRAGDRRLLIGFAVIAVAGLGLVAARSFGSGHGRAKLVGGLTAAQRADQRAAEQWQPKATAAFRPTTAALGGFVTDTQHWAAGTLPDGEFRAHAQAALGSFVASRDAAAALPPFSVAPQAKDLYRQAALLYEQSARVELAATVSPPGALRVQERVLGQRLRELADRVFDRGGALVVAALHQPANPNLVINLPEEVPIWPAEGLAAGPPLDSATPGPVGVPPQHQPTRATQPRAEWRSVVAALPIPSAAEVAGAIGSGPADDLAVLARRLTAAAESLRTTPDPVGDREGATVVRLGLLVGAEACRAAQAARLEGSGPAGAALEVVAQRLALVSDRLWATDLAPRRSGFGDDLLHAQAH
jgi:hypothetical protein